MQRYKVLISAYACNPRKGSEDGVGWGWMRAIAQYHDLWVLTAEYHRQDIERFVSMNGEALRNVTFCYVEHRPWHYRPTRGWIRIEHSIFKPVMNWAYRLWQWDAYKLGRELHRQVRFDLVHQITYVGFRFPGHLWKLDIPFVWGPVAGLKNTPWRFLPTLGFRGCLYYAGRNIINSYHRACLRDPKKAFRKAHGGIITATAEERENIRRWYGQHSEVICEIGPPSDVADHSSERHEGQVLRLAWSGQHEPGKALPILLRALARLPEKLDWQLDVLGQGTCTAHWQRLATRVGVASRCRWHGWLPRDEAIAVMRGSHVFVITSLKDLTSSVLLEALAQGVPVICPDHCGFRDVVTDHCGIRVPVNTPKQLEAGIENAICRLAGDESSRRRLAEGALLRVKDFGWEEKARKVDTIYRRVVAART